MKCPACDLEHAEDDEDVGALCKSCRDAQLVRSADDVPEVVVCTRAYTIAEDFTRRWLCLARNKRSAWASRRHATTR